MEHGIELELVKMTRSIIFRFNSISTRVIILKWTGSFCHILEDFTQPWFAKYNQHIIQCFVKSMVNCKPMTPQNDTTVPGHLRFLERARPRSYTERLIYRTTRTVRGCFAKAWSDLHLGRKEILFYSPNSGISQNIICFVRGLFNMFQCELWIEPYKSLSLTDLRQFQISETLDPKHIVNVTLIPVDNFHEKMATLMLVITLCWWLCDGDKFKMFVTESLCKRFCHYVGDF